MYNDTYENVVLGSDKKAAKNSAQQLFAMAELKLELADLFVANAMRDK